jgi:hypothetical protein
VVITLQAPAQAREVRTLMKRANVIPLAATVSPGSPLLRSIAGPPAKPLPAAAPAAPRTTAAKAGGAGAVAMSSGYRGRRRR